MKCQSVVSLLSELVDEVLDSRQSDQVLQHLDHCSHCRREFDRTRTLRKKLRLLGNVEAPEYLSHMLRLGLEQAKRSTLREELRDALEYRWSMIRTAGGMGYVTKIVGTVMASLFFFLITSAMNPIYVELPVHGRDKGLFLNDPSKQLSLSVLKNLGIISREAQRRPIQASGPQINDLYLLDFGQNASLRGQDDTFTVVTGVDRSGSAKIQSVLEYPSDPILLSEFNSMITNARCRPASQNGHAVDSHMVLTFSKISVYD